MSDLSRRTDYATQVPRSSTESAALLLVDGWVSLSARPSRQATGGSERRQAAEQQW
jgi:hypothetical protein